MSALAAFYWLAAGLLLVVGFLGARWIARHLPIVRALAAMAVWFASPFVALAMLLASAIDPTLSAERASYNFWFGYVLIAFVISLPWTAVLAIGFVVGRNRRPVRAPAPPQPVSLPGPSLPMAPAPADAVPDWRHADHPKLSIEELGERMREIAARLVIDEARLPGLYTGREGGGEGTFLDHDKFDYIYAYRERGQIAWQHPEVIADKMLFRVFSDLAFAEASRTQRGDGDDEYPVRVRREQCRILAHADVRWANQCRLDYAREGKRV